MFNDLKEQTIELLDEMSPEEFIYSFRGYLEMKCIDKQLISKFIEKTQECLNLKNLNYDQTYVLMWGFTELPQEEINADIIELIKQLEQRLKEL